MPLKTPRLSKKLARSIAHRIQRAGPAQVASYADWDRLREYCDFASRSELDPFQLDKLTDWTTEELGLPRAPKPQTVLEGVEHTL